MMEIKLKHTSKRWSNSSCNITSDLSPKFSKNSAEEFDRLSHALKEGLDPLSVSKCLLHGYPGVGKTHVKSLLLQQPLKHTLCGEHPQRAIRNVSVEKFGISRKFEIMDDEILVSSFIAEAADHLDASKNYTRVNESESMALQNESEAMKGIDLRLQQSRVNHHQEIMYFIDTGGQPQFHDILPAFLRSTTVILLLSFKLTEKLSDAPLIQHQSIESSHTLGRYAVTNEEIIMKFARMVYSSNSDVLIAFIGTHRDQYSENVHETIQEKDSRLLDIFSFCRHKLLYHDLRSGSLLFPLNGLQAVEGKFDDPVVCKLRSAIGSNNMVKVDVPLRWFSFELALRSHAETIGCHVLSMGQCEQIARRLNLSEDDLRVALKFFCNFNLILYYPTVLPNVVFTSPQILLDKVTELVECVYKLAGIEIQISTFPFPICGEHLRMRDEGICTVDILRDFPKHYAPGLFTEEDLLKILEHLHIVAPLNHGQFFMPALLPRCTPEDLKQLHDPSKPPLLFHFSEGCVPAGLLCALLVCLTSPQIGWKFFHNSKLLKGVRENAACLDFGLGILIALVDSYCQIEVHYRCHSGREKYLCKVNEVIREALEKVVSDWKYNVAFPRLSFFCRSADHPCLYGENVSPHISTPIFRDAELVCSVDSTVVYEMNEIELHWLEPVPLPPLASNSPSIDQLAFELEGISDRWYEIGTSLKIPMWKLAAIERSCNYEIERLVGAFVYWQKNARPGYSFSWDTIIKALQLIGSSDLAKEIQAKYGNDIN